MPTDRGSKTSQTARATAEQTYTMPVTGPHNLVRNSRLAVGVGLHLLSPAFAGMVAIVSLAAMKRLPSTSMAGLAFGARQTRSANPADRTARLFALRQDFHGLKEYPRGL